MAFLAGLVAVLVPDQGDWTVTRAIALAFAVVALLVELILVTGFPAPMRRALHPEIGDDDKLEHRFGMPQLPDEVLRRLVPEFAPRDPAPPDWARLADVLSALEHRLAMLPPTPPTPPGPAGPTPAPAQPAGGGDGAPRPTRP